MIRQADTDKKEKNRERERAKKRKRETKREKMRSGGSFPGNGGRVAIEKGRPLILFLSAYN